MKRFAALRKACGTELSQNASQVMLIEFHPFSESIRWTMAGEMRLLVMVILRPPYYTLKWKGAMWMNQSSQEFSTTARTDPVCCLSCRCGIQLVRNCLVRLCRGHSWRVVVFNLRPDACFLCTVMLSRATKEIRHCCEIWDEFKAGGSLKR